LSNLQIAEFQGKREQETLIGMLMKEYGISKASVYQYLIETVPITATGASDI